MSNEQFPSIFKVKTPKLGDDVNLGKMYDFLFDVLNCGWLGRSGHYCYDEDPTREAKNQDGFIYCWIHCKTTNKRYISADPTAFNYLGKFENIPEIVIDQIKIA